jgi:hypothetical protein
MSVAPAVMNTHARPNLPSGNNVYNASMTGPMGRIVVPNFDNALCVNTPSEWFYEEDTVKPQLEVVELARLVCAPCVERVRCLEWAMQNEKYGMWGGVTANERSAIKGEREHDLKVVKELGWI